MTDTKQDQYAAAGSPEGAPEATHGITLRSVLLGLFFLVAVNLMMRGTEFVMGRYITAGVPPVAAVSVLVLLLLFNPLLRGPLARFRFSRGEALVIYAGLCLGFAITGTYGVRAIFPYFSALHYFDQPTNQFLQLAEELPGWFILKNTAAIQALYEGSPGKGVPWAAWRGVLLGWGSFMLMLFAGMAALTAIVRRPWAEHERLMFPVTQLPLALTDPGISLLPNSIFWFGFLVAGLMNATNIGHAFVDAIPAIAPTYAMPAEIQRPWTPVRTMTIFNRPELYGFAWWVPNEILLSGWLSYLLVKAYAVGGTMAGLDQPGFPYMQEQSTGGYLALALILLWGMRKHLARVVASLWRGFPDDDREPMSYRVAVILLVLSLLYCSWYLTTAYVPRWLAISYMVMIFTFALVYTRLRVEAGLALEFIYPYGYPRRSLIYALGSDRLLMAGAGTKGLTGFYVGGWLARFHHASWIAAYSLESMRLAQASGVKQRAMMRWITFAFAVGLVLATVNYLSYNYSEGLNFFEGKPGSADWRTNTVVQEYNELNQFIQMPQGTDPVRLGYMLGGGVVTALLAVGRLTMLGFPLHPAGYVLATAYGDTSPMWWPFFVIWLLKTFLLKYGGLKAYRRWIPFFVGFIIAHYLIGGLGWSILSAYATPDIAHRYYTIFG